MASRVGWVASIAVAVAVLGVFLPWTSVGSASLDGTQGPNNGWLVVIVGAFTLGLIRLMARGSWVGVIGVFAASIVMFWTAAENWLDNRRVLGGTAGYGLVVVIAASAVLAATAVTTAVCRGLRCRGAGLRGRGRVPP